MKDDNHQAMEGTFFWGGRGIQFEGVGKVTVLFNFMPDLHGE